MSEQYKGEGLGSHYTRLQAQREQREKTLQQHRRVDTSTQIGNLTEEATVDQEAQIEVASSSNVE